MTVRAMQVDCDKLGPQAYARGTDTFQEVVAAFGPEVVDAATGEIDRRRLGAAVFGGDGSGLERLNGIVWPAIRRLAAAEVARLGGEGVEVVVVEAAVLLEAGWDDLADEVWAVTVPEAAAVARLAARNGLSEEAALQRIRKQMPNEERLSRAHVMLSNQWTLDEARLQLDSAWAGVASRAARHLFGGPGAAGGEMDLMARRWREASDAVGAERGASTAWYRRVWGMYAGRCRFHHGLGHVREVLAAVDEMAAGGVAVARPELVSLAVLFHDAVYEPTRADNEEESARLFLAFAAAAAPGLADADREAVAGWIRRTAAHHGGGPAEGDAAVVLDADLAVLGAPAPRYAAYAEAIRREYVHLAEPDFVRARAAALEGLAAAPALFRTPHMAARLERPARENIGRELARLRAAAAVYAD